MTTEDAQHFAGSIRCGVGGVIYTTHLNCKPSVISV